MKIAEMSQEADEGLCSLLTLCTNSKSWPYGQPLILRELRSEPRAMLRWLGEQLQEVANLLPESDLTSE